MIKMGHIEGLKDRTKKAGQTSTEQLSKETSYQIKKELKESNQKGGDHKTEVEEFQS